MFDTLEKTRNNPAYDRIWIPLALVTALLAWGGSLFDLGPQHPVQVSSLAVVLIACQAALFGIRRSSSEKLAGDLVLPGVLHAVHTTLWVALLFISPIWFLYLPSLLIQLHLDLPIQVAAGFDLLLIGAGAIESSEAFGFTFINLTLWVLLSVAGVFGGLRIYDVIQQRIEQRRLREALASTQAELIAAERREGILAERGRLAREIHDTLAQGYIGVIMHLEAADELLNAGVDPEKARSHMRQAEDMARIGLRDARAVVQDLRPEILNSAEDIHSAIEEVAETWSAQSRIPTEVSVAGDPVWTHPEVELTLLRVTQEGLSNILKHAQAEQVRITLSYIGDQVALDIEDDGIGIDHATPPDREQGAGFGLRGMRERVEEMGGELFIESEPDEGTTLTVVCPSRIVASG